MASLSRVGGLVCTLLLGVVMSACGDSSADDAPAAGSAGPTPASTASATDPAGDTWRADAPGKRSKRTANVDLTGLSATYDDAGLVLGVSYGEPLDPAAGRFGVLVTLDHDAASKDDGITLQWSSTRPTQVKVSDSVDYLYFCKARVATDYATGALTFTVPATSGCLGKTPPDRMRVRSVTGYTGDVEDDMFSDRRATGDSGFWVSRA
jgi:hypothetical protein